MLIIDVHLDLWMECLGIVQARFSGRRSSVLAGVDWPRWRDRPQHGADLDGCLRLEQTPNDLNAIADLQKEPELLPRRGYT